MHSEGSDPCDDTLEGNHPHGPSRPILPLDGSDRRDAGRVEQAEGQEGECHARCQKRRESFLRPVEDRQGRDDTLLGHESGDERRRKLPVCKTERCKERRDSAGKEGEDTVLGIRYHIETDIKVLQEPDDDGCQLSLTADPQESILAWIASGIAPLFAPLGFGDWRVSTALITGFMAKESVVSTLTILYGSSAALGAALSPAAAAPLLVFCLLYTPCIAAVASVKREMGGRWATVMVVNQCVVAWLAALVVRFLAVAVL